jgi:ubiquinone/menaquinone biosynthesis C-methylase UbiE
MSTDSDMQAHYALGREAARLSEGLGVVEFERTSEIILRALPAPPAVVADVGGGPGRYALWLAELGHRVEHRDLAPGHVEQLASARPDAVTTRVGDARRLDLADSSVDAVLLLGPLYHL